MVFGGIPRPVAVCGLYYTPKSQLQQERLFLPQVQLEAHATILQTTSRVTLTQTFINPSTTKGIRQVNYVFPLYEGVSVVGFTCHVADRVIVGEVKEKHEAKHDYTKAIVRGETAGLFEQLDTSDTFMTTVGNVPPGARVDVKITYLGELKHDMEVDGIRFTIPSIITPRYGRTAPGYDSACAEYACTSHANGSGISVTVDVEMAEGSFIQKVLSPSHPISVSMGTTSIAPNREPSLSKASATLGITSTCLETDFILQIVAKDTGLPKAVLETHPTIPNQRALMATLVPKFALPPENPEIVFVCDRSGSMLGSNIVLVKQALQVFLKSLPVGVMFNICSFGSSYSFLWPKSVAYSQQTLDEAVAHVNTFDANYGGTEMLAPLKATIEQRYKDIPLEVMMLTDGAIWNQSVLFAYLNEQVQKTKAPIRVYSLGVGSGVSHSLIEGLARAGNGFSQTVGQGEKMDSKVVRMLKGALSPHVSDYMLEVKYGGSMSDTEEEDDFEIVERVADSLKVKLGPSEMEGEPKSVKSISLFDPSADPDKTDPTASTNMGDSRYAHLPKVLTPNIIQAPQDIPPLFAFIRTTIYLLLGPDAPQQIPKSVVLRGTSTQGPLELEFPLQVLDKPGETIHQLAAKKATYELEEGRGWLSEAKDESGKLLKERYESRFSSMVEREAVRLGVQFQVSGKWCSFVAVEKNKKTEEGTQDADWECLEDEPAPDSPVPSGGLFGTRVSATFPVQGASPLFASQQVPAGSLFGGSQPAQRQFQFGFGPAVQGGSLFGSATNQAAQSAPGSLFGSSSTAAGPPASLHGPNSLFGGSMAGTSHLSQPPPQNAQVSGGLFGSNTPTQGGGLFGSSTPGRGEGLFVQQQQQASPRAAPSQGNQSLQDYQMSIMLLEQQNKKRQLMTRQEQDNSRHMNRITAKTDKMNDQITMNRARLGRIDGSPAHASFPTHGFGTHSSVGSQKPSLFGASTSASGFGTTPPGAANMSGQPSPFGLNQPPKASGLFGSGLFGVSTSTPASSSLFGSGPPPASAAPSSRLFGSTPLVGLASGKPASSPAPRTDDEILALLVKLQTFEGFWEFSPSLFLALPVTETEAEDALTIFNYDLALKANGEGREGKAEYEKSEWTTALAIVQFEEKLASLRGSWELVVEKARSWLEKTVGGNRVEEVLGRAKAFFKQVEEDDGTKARFG